jgi:hypothetical protein
MIVLFINCKLFPFISWIIAGIKVFETRNRNTLKSIIGKRVFIAETGKYKRPLIRCAACFDNPVIVDNRKDFNRYRKQTKIKKGSCFDFIPGRKKYLYPVCNVQQVNPFFLPDNAVYHGRVYATIDE